MAFRGALVYKTTDQPIPNSTNADLTYDTVVYDIGGLFDHATSRFVIPAGVSKVKLKAQIIWANNAAGLRQTVIKKNFVAGDLSTGWYPGVPASTIPANPNTTTDVSAMTPVLEVVEGDYFLVEGFYYTGASGATITARGSVGTWFSIEVLE